MTDVDIHAGFRRDGEVVHECIPVERLREHEFRALATPALGSGFAAGDTITVDDVGRVAVVRYGGNVGIQVYGRGVDTAIVMDVAAQIGSRGGRVDSLGDRVAVFTVPVAAGFPFIENTFNALTAAYDGLEWYYTNVYDAADEETPINWWTDS